MVEHLYLAAPVRPALTEAALCAWIGQAYPGEQLVYHCGFLAIDTAPDSRALTPAARQELRRVANRAYQLFEQGLVHLVQRRVGPAKYSYIAVARSRPVPRTASGALRAVLSQAGLSAPAQPVRRSA